MPEKLNQLLAADHLPRPSQKRPKNCQRLLLQQDLFGQPVLTQFSDYKIGFKFSEAYMAWEYRICQ